MPQVVGRVGLPSCRQLDAIGFANDTVKQVQVAAFSKTCCYGNAADDSTGAGRVAEQVAGERMGQGDIMGN